MLVGVRDVQGVTHDVSPAGPSPVTLSSGGVDGLVAKPEVVSSTSGFVPGRLVHGLTTPPVEACRNHRGGLVTAGTARWVGSSSGGCPRWGTPRGDDGPPGR